MAHTVIKLHKAWYLLIVFFFSLSITHAQMDTVNCERVGSPIDMPDFIETAPAVSMDGKTMIFVSNKNDGTKLFVTTKNDNNEWSEPSPLTDINSFGNIGSYIDCPFLSYNGMKLYFAANFSQGFGGMDIYMSKKKDGKWGQPQNLGPVINTAKNEMSPSLPIGDDIIYFCRKNLEAENKTDNCQTIFSASIVQGNWQDPKPLPEIINYGCEETPFISYDNASLYFSSIRSDDPAMYRLYKSVKIDEEIWTACTPIYSNADMLHDLNPMVVFNDNSLYYSKKIPDKKDKQEDIYRCALKEEEQPAASVYIEGTVFINDDKKSRSNAKIEVIDNETSVKITETSSNSDGKYTLLLKTNKNYKVYVTYDNTTTIAKEFMLKATTKNTFVKQDFILFDTVKLKLNILKVLTDGLAQTEAQVTIKGLQSGQTYKPNDENGQQYYSLPLTDIYRLEVKKDGYKTFVDSLVLSGAVFKNEFDCRALLLPVMREMQIKVIDFSKGSGIKANVRISSINSSFVKMLVCEPKNEEFTKINLKGDEKYLIEVLPEEGYSFFTKEINLSVEKANSMELRLRKLEQDMTFPIEGMDFRPGTTDLTKDAMRAANSLLWMMLQNPTLQIELSLAHANSTDKELITMQLKSIRAYLYTQGVDVGRVSLTENNSESINPLNGSDSGIELLCTVKSIL